MDRENTSERWDDQTPGRNSRVADIESREGAHDNGVRKAGPTIRVSLGRPFSCFIGLTKSPRGGR